MSTAIESKIGSTLYARLNAVRMTEVERQRALIALHDAHLLVDAFVWVAKKIEQFGARLFLNPALPH
jgi:hypothetical protein